MRSRALVLLESFGFSFLLRFEARFFLGLSLGILLLLLLGLVVTFLLLSLGFGIGLLLGEFGEPLLFVFLVFLLDAIEAVFLGAITHLIGLFIVLGVDLRDVLVLSASLLFGTSAPAVVAISVESGGDKVATLPREGCQDFAGLRLGAHLGISLQGVLCKWSLALSIAIVESVSVVTEVWRFELEVGSRARGEGSNFARVVFLIRSSVKFDA